MSRIYMPTTGPEDWKGKLAGKDNHWKDGFSAKSLAECWEGANGFPKGIKEALDDSEFKQFGEINVLFGFPEYKVTLPGGGHASQNDLYVIAKAGSELVSIMVEGKVNEPFGEKVRKWLGDVPSNGKQERLAFLLELLNLKEDNCMEVRYQLLHRTASALIEAEKINAKHAIMLVHSFSKEYKWFEDYKAFVRLFGLNTEKDRIFGPVNLNGIDLYLGWVSE